jgi:phenylpropionate dioxygenase-like ring-hydroxylating dioxygenase large terminal subunit
VTTITRFLLPPEVYYSDEWFEREQEELFARTWNFVGPVSDVPSDGSSVLTTAGPHRITIDRDDQGFVAHRADGAASAVDTWAGFLFVHAEPERARRVRDWLGDLPDLIGAFRPDELIEVAAQRFEVAANWKLYIENHIDVYHLWYLHEESLATYDHPRHRWDDCAPHWSFYEPLRNGVLERPQHGLPIIDHIGPDDWGSGAHLIFPNVPFASGAMFFMTYQCIPRGPEHTTIDLRVRAQPGSEPDVAAVVAMFQRVLYDEDGFACERIQAALRSPHFAVGPLAVEHERPITLFHEHLLAAMR